MSRHALRSSGPGTLAFALLLATGGFAAPALAQDAGDADLAAMHQRALVCQLGAPDCEQMRDQLMLRLSEQVEFCTDASCDQARTRLSEQIQLRECDSAVMDCASMQQQMMMMQGTQPAAGQGLQGGAGTAPAGTVQPGQDPGTAGAIQPGEGVEFDTPAGAN